MDLFMCGFQCSPWHSMATSPDCYRCCIRWEFQADIFSFFFFLVWLISIKYGIILSDVLISV
jgi:hypothetical protein